VTNSTISNLHVLVVEDDFLVRMDLTQQLIELGCAAIAHVPSVEAALQHIANVRVDFAVLDVVLTDGYSDPVAAVLNARRIPAVVITGLKYNSLSNFLRRYPVFPKPFPKGGLARAIRIGLDRDL